MDADDPRSIPKHDYTKGQLSELIDVIIRSKATLFVCAVGVPPRDVVDKLHAAGIAVMKYDPPSSNLSNRADIQLTLA